MQGAPAAPATGSHPAAVPQQLREEPEAGRGPPVLHKDFYLRNPDPVLQCEQYCWGNLEATHPVLSRRSLDEVDRYRREHGLLVETIKGRRKAPKPFQSFEETSFPKWVAELAYELFTSDARPFPAQAQAWPCALSGMDLIAVAPTGSGKTLGYLLPALVHIMAQPQLQRGEGPIVTVLVPTRELAQQTHAVASRFCERTSGEDTIRTSAVFGGVLPDMQLPSQDSPHDGRWPELLVATPGRLRFLLGSDKYLGSSGLSRTSYIVVDEADLLLSPGSWLDQVRALLALGHPDRQLLLVSATWSPELDAVAAELCGEELVRLQIFPDVPCIPQDINLFFADYGDSEQVRKQALLHWMREELRPDEAVLLLCNAVATAKDLATDKELTGALGSGPGLVAAPPGDDEEAVGTEQAFRQDQWQEYRRFVTGDVRMLVKTFTVGARGLDYADTTAKAEEAKRLPLAVVLFDFPRSITEYIHCIGRTHRPGQRAGRAVVFMPEMRFWMAGELLSLLKRCQQPVPGELKDLVEKDGAFQREYRQAMIRLRETNTIWPGSAGATPLSDPDDGSEFDEERRCWSLSPSLPSYRRRLIHAIAREEDLPHVSTGTHPGRRLHIAQDRKNLPDKFFIEGELVEAPPLQPRPRRGSPSQTAEGGAAPRRGRVTDPKIHPRNRTVRVRFEGEEKDTIISVDKLQLC